jgi:competence protein ComEC
MPNGIAFEFLDTGMGDGTLIQLPPWDRGGLCLFDFGERGSPFKVAARDATRFLVKRITEVSKNRGLDVPTLDVLFLSHPDGDHWNKVDWLIDGATDETTGLWEDEGWDAGTTLHIRKLVFGGDWEDDYVWRNEERANVITAAVTAAGGTIQALGDADCDAPVDGVVTPRWIYRPGVANETVKIYLLSSNLPTRGAAATNPLSLVVMFEYQDRKVILTGDAESAVVEPAILETYEGTGFLKSLALKLGHHGSAGASSDAWLEAVGARAVFASGDRRWGHPYCVAIDRAIGTGTLDDGAMHRYACSAPDGGDFTNHRTEKLVCTNLWYVVTDPDGETLEGPDGDYEHGDQGLYNGVQWRLQLDPGSDPYLSFTDAWPKP